MEVKKKIKEIFGIFMDYLYIGLLVVLLIFTSISLILSIFDWFHSKTSEKVNKCASPEVYCSSFKIAKSCNAIDYCALIWSHESATYSDTGFDCNICRRMMTQARTRLTPKKIKDIKSVYDDYCDIMSDGKKQCVELTTKYSSQINTILFFTNITSDVICSVAEICRRETCPEQSSIQLCPLCEFYMRLVEEKIPPGANQDQILKTVSETCDRMPKTLVEDCHKVMKYYTMEIIELIMAQAINVQEICPKIGMCPSPQVAAETSLSSLTIVDRDMTDSKPKCGLCLFVVDSAQELIENDRTDEHIKKILTLVCNTLSTTLRSQCLDIIMIEKYSKELIELLATNISPQIICENIKLCGDDILKFDLPLNDNADAVLYSSMCRQIIINVKNLLKDSKSENDIRIALDHACDKQKERKADCQQLINMQKDKILELVMKNVAIKKVFQLLGICNNTLSMN